MQSPKERNIRKFPRPIPICAGWVYYFSIIVDSGAVLRRQGRVRWPTRRIPRRKFLVGAGLAGTAVATGLTPDPPAEAQAPAAPPAASAPQAEPLLLLNETEHAFVVAAVDTIIPADELSPSGSDCGCATYIDRQLASAWGGGAKMYRAGPVLKGKPEQGYQLPLTPARVHHQPASPPPMPGRARPTAAISTGSIRTSASRRSRRCRRARPNSRISIPAPSSPGCWRSPWKASSPIRSMAATATWRRGRCSAIPACRRPTPTHR